MCISRSALKALAPVALVLAGCGGHSAGLIPLQPVASSQAAPAAGTAAVTFVFVVQPPSAFDPPGLAHQHFIASSTKSIEIDVYRPSSKHTKQSLLASAIVKVAKGSPGCKIVAGKRSCSATLRLPPPSADIVLSGWDQLPAGGTIPAKAKQLSGGSFIDQKIRSGATLRLTLGGIPEQIAVTLPGGTQTATIHGVAASTTTIGFAAMDADGNVILTDAFVDAQGKPAGIAMTATPSAKTCGSALLENGPVANAAIEVSAPPKGGIGFVYGSSAIAQTFTPAHPCSFTVTAKLRAKVRTATFELSGPELTQFANPATPSQVSAIVVGPDGNMWFADGAADAIGTIDVTTKAIVEYPVGTSPQGLAVGPDKNLWFDAFGTLGSITTSGTVLAGKPFSVGTSNDGGQQLAVSPDGNFWFTDASDQVVVRMTPSGTVTAFAPLTASPKPYPNGIATGPDGNMWFAECLGGKIERISPAGTNAKEFAVPNGYPTYMLAGPDGNLWFTSCPGRSISKLTTSGTFTSFKIPPVGSGSQPFGLAIGPDGAIWFADLDGRVGRVPTGITDASQITEFEVAPGNEVYWVAAGSDGALWFTERVGSTATSVIGRLSL